MILAPQFGYEAFVKTKNVSLSKLQLTLWFSLPLTDTIILFHTLPADLFGGVPVL